MKTVRWVLAEIFLALVRWAPIFILYGALTLLVDPWIRQQNSADQPYLFGVVYGPFLVAIVVYLLFFHRRVDPIIKRRLPFLDQEAPAE